MWPFKKTNYTADLAVLLAQSKNQEDLLGVSPVQYPTANKVMQDAAKILQYSQSADYKIFAEEAWARVLGHLDVILNPKTPTDQIQDARGALRATLDLLRLSHQARLEKQRLEKDHTRQNVPSPR